METKHQILLVILNILQLRSWSCIGIAHDNYYRGGIPVSTQLELSNQNYFALIETKEGADNANEIASLTDVDCLWLSLDLSASLGIPGQFDHHLYKES